MANGRVTTQETGVMYRNVIIARRCAPQGRRCADRFHNNIIIYTYYIYYIYKCIQTDGATSRDAAQIATLDTF